MRAVRPWLLTFAFIATSPALACGGDDGGEQTPTQTSFGGDRPVEVQVPPDYDHAAPTPLILVLHGHGAAGALELAYSRLGNLVLDSGVLVVAPDGLMNDEGNRYWKITNERCEFEPDGPDDIPYLVGLVEEIASVYNVDPARIFIFGHSNGGFMAYKLACEHSELFAAIISLAGSTTIDAMECSPTEPVSVVQIHGDADDTVPYEGGEEIIGIPCDHPSAPQMVEQWADHNGCTGDLVEAPTKLDLEDPFDEPDTLVERIEGCPENVGVELWTIEGGGHIPSFVFNIELSLWSFFEAHAKP